MRVDNLTHLLSRTLAALLFSVLFSVPSHADKDSLHITNLAVYPPDVSLHTMRDFQGLLVVGTNTGGVSYDLTRQAEYAFDASRCKVESGTVYPVSDGETTITITCEGHSIELPVSVVNARQERPISFKLDIMPVFMASGCNSGACHGSAIGQDGFRLSLFGFDPDSDYYRITREMSGRRINLARPEESLLVEKSLGKVIHTGGKRFDADHPAYETMVRWISANTPRDGNNIAHVMEVEMFPPEGVLQGKDQTFGIIVRARYSDGTDRDITNLCLYRTTNETSINTKDGYVTSGSPGEAFITASFDTFTVGIPFIVLSQNAPAASSPGSLPASNYIDELINLKLSILRIDPSSVCSDEIFIRRVYLDLIGLFPTQEEVQTFLSEETPEKRSLLIDKLLERREFVDQWVMQFAELLQIRSNNEISYKAALSYFEWLRNCFSNNMPLDEMVRRILTATGGTFTEPATNFYLNQNDTLVLTENVAQAFMGIRIQCTQCHNHPFDRWTQNDYYGFVSFFTQVGRKRAEDPRETIIFNRRSGEYNHPVSKKPLPPKFLGGEIPDIKGRDRRAVAAEWLTSPDNPFFAKSLANRVWEKFIGVGIVDPVDDFRVSNPASNAGLLDALAERLVAAKYDLKQLVRDICNSQAYQRSTQTTETNKNDSRNFSHGLVRRLRAETLLDVICQVTEQPEKLRGLPLGARAVEIADGTTTNYFLTTFGRAKRESVCACEVVREPSLSQALHLLNGSTVHQKVIGGNIVGKLLDAGKTPEQVVKQLYLRCLQRAPTATELSAVMALLEGEEQVKPALEDTFWAIINSREFFFNH